MEDGQPQIAGLEPQVFVVPDLQLAVFADDAFGSEQHSGVVQAVAAVLVQTGVEIDLPLPRQVLEHPAAPASRDGFGQCERFLAVREHISADAELGQHDQLRAVIRGLGCLGEAVRQVSFRLPHNGLHLHDGDLYGDLFLDLHGVTSGNAKQVGIGAGTFLFKL